MKKFKIIILLIVFSVSMKAKEVRLEYSIGEGLRRLGIRAIIALL